jgi:hypothetical protein
MYGYDSAMSRILSISSSRLYAQTSWMCALEPEASEPELGWPGSNSVSAEVIAVAMIPSRLVRRKNSRGTSLTRQLESQLIHALRQVDHARAVFIYLCRASCALKLSNLQHCIMTKNIGVVALQVRSARSQYPFPVGCFH